MAKPQLLRVLVFMAVNLALIPPMVWVGRMLCSGESVPTVQTGNLLFLSGMLATSGHTATVVGVVGNPSTLRALGDDEAQPRPVRVSLRHGSRVRTDAESPRIMPSGRVRGPIPSGNARTCRQVGARRHAGSRDHESIAVMPR